MVDTKFPVGRMVVVRNIEDDYDDWKIFLGRSGKVVAIEKDADFPIKVEFPDFETDYFKESELELITTNITFV